MFIYLCEHDACLLWSCPIQARFHLHSILSFDGELLGILYNLCGKRCSGPVLSHLTPRIASTKDTVHLFFSWTIRSGLNSLSYSDQLGPHELFEHL